MAEKGVVEVILKARDLTGRALTRFRRRWRALRRVIRNVTRTVIAGTAAMAGMTLALTRLSQQGDKILAVKAAFARITRDEAAALDRLRQAAAGTIDDFKLMSLANQAMTLGAAQNVEQFAEMVEISRALGRAQGVDALHALESFTIGLARQSPRILDNIGLQIKLGDTTTFAARALDLAREKAAELTGGIEAGATAGAKFATTMSNLKNRISEVVAQSPLMTEFFERVSGVIDDLIEIVGSDRDLIKRGFAELGTIAGNSFTLAVRTAIEGARDFFKSMWDVLWPEEFRVPEDKSPFAGRSGLAGEGSVLDRALDESAEQARENIRVAEEILGEIADEARRRREERAASMPGGAAGAPSRAPFTMPEIGRDLPTFGSAREFRRQRNLAAGERVGLGTSLPTLEPIHTEGAAKDTELAEAEQEMEDFRQTAVAAFGGAAAAAIRGTDRIAESVIAMITDIARSIPGVGGFGGALIGAVGGIFGALVSRNRRRDPVPVRLQDVDRRAAEALRDRDRGPERVTVIIKDAQGRTVEFFERELIDRQSRDEIERHSPRTGTPIGI